MRRGDMSNLQKPRPYLKYLLTLALGPLIGLVLLWLVFLLPSDGMLNNVTRSIPEWEQEGAYPQLIEGIPVTQLDNYTDAWAMDLAANTRGDGVYTAWQRACNPHFGISSAPENEDWSIASGFFNYLKDPSAPSELGYYGIYWCATVIPLRLGLSFFTYQQLRVINLVLQVLLIVAVTAAMWKAYGWKYAVPVAVIVAAMYMPAVWRSIQQSSCFYLSMGGCLYMAVRHIRGKDHKPPAMAFMVLGMLSAYFPFLTYPMIILALPLLCHMAGQVQGAPWDKVKRVVWLSFLWGVGFGVMWSSKWLILWLSGNGDMALTAFNKISDYGTDKGQTRLGILLLNLTAYPKKWMAAMLAPTALLGAWGLYKHRGQWKHYLMNMLPFALIMLIPMVWILLTPSHALLHFWFTCRNFSVVFSGLCFMALAVPVSTAADAPRKLDA